MRAPPFVSCPGRLVVSACAGLAAIAAWRAECGADAVSIGAATFLTPALFTLRWLFYVPRRRARAEALKIALAWALTLVALVRALKAGGMDVVWGPSAAVAGAHVAALAPLYLASLALRRALPRRAIPALSALAAAALFALALPFLMLSFAARQPHGAVAPGAVDFDEGEPISVTVRGGVELRGRWYPRPRARGAVLLVHGLGADSVQFLPALRTLYQRGYSILIYDQRGHGRSGGLTTSFGRVEADDLARVWRELLGRSGNVPHFLFGVSAGGAAARLASSRLASLDGLILDSSFASIEDVARARFPAAIAPVAIALAHRVAPFVFGFDALAGPEAEGASREGPPVLILHDRHDPLIAYEESTKLLRAYGPRATRIDFDAGTHAGAWATSPLDYDRALASFVRRVEDGRDSR